MHKSIKAGVDNYRGVLSMTYNSHFHPFKEAQIANWQSSLNWKNMNFKSWRWRDLNLWPANLVQEALDHWTTVSCHLLVLFFMYVIVQFASLRKICATNCFTMSKIFVKNLKKLFGNFFLKHKFLKLNSK